MGVDGPHRLAPPDKRYFRQDLAPKIYKTPTVGLGSKYPGRCAGGDHLDDHSQAPAKARVLARGTAAELIEAFIAAYSDVDYNRQLLAAAHRPGSGHDCFEDKRRLATVRLGFDSPVLERFGFSPTTLGQIRARSALDDAVRTFEDLKEARSKMEALALPKEGPLGEGEAVETGGKADGAVERPHSVTLSNTREQLFHPLTVNYDMLPGRRWLCVGGENANGLEVSIGGEDTTVNLEEDCVVEYLQPGAVVEEVWLMRSTVEYHHQRLEYKLITGTGPPQGWVFLQDGLGDGHDFMLPLEGPVFPPMHDGFADGVAVAPEREEPEVATAVSLFAEDAPDPNEAWVEAMREAAAEVAPARERAEDALESMVRLKNRDGIEKAIAQGLAAGAEIQDCYAALEMLKRLTEAAMPEKVTGDRLTKEELEDSHNHPSLKFKLALTRYRFEEQEKKRGPAGDDPMKKFADQKRVKQGQMMCSVCYNKAPALEENIFNGQFVCSDCVRERRVQQEEEARRALAMDDWIAALEGPEHPALEAGQLALEVPILASAEARLQALDDEAREQREAEGACYLAAQGSDIERLAAAIDLGLALCISDDVLRGASRRLSALRAEALGVEADSHAVKLLDSLEQQCQTPEFLADLNILVTRGGPTYRVGLGILLTKQCLVAASTHGLGEGWTFESTRQFLVEHAHSAGIAERLRVFELSLVPEAGGLLGEIPPPAGPAPPAEPPGHRAAPPEAAAPEAAAPEARDDDGDFQVVQTPEVDMPVMPVDEKEREREALRTELTRVREDKVAAVRGEDFLRAHANQQLEKDLLARLEALE